MLFCFEVSNFPILKLNCYARLFGRQLCVGWVKKTCLFETNTIATTVTVKPRCYTHLIQIRRVVLRGLRAVVRSVKLVAANAGTGNSAADAPVSAGSVLE